MKNGVLCVAFLLHWTIAYAEDPASSFGQEQLARLLSDRPEMQSVLPDDDVVTRWVVRRLNCGPYGERVRWDKREPLSGRPAENQPADSSGNALVRITGDTSVHGRDKWFMLVFELHNIPHPEAVSEMSRLVREQRIDRHDFALQCVRHEFVAMQRTLRFFSRYPIPDATPTNAPLYMQYTAAKNTDFQTYVKHLDTLKSGDYDPREHFANWYDQLRANHSAAFEAEPSD